MAGDGLDLADSGITKGSHEEGVMLIVIIVFLSISFYNFLELTAITFTTFRKWRGLYFWSFVVSTWGIVVYSLGFLMKDLALTDQWWLYVTFIEVGWSSMVTGQSMVLYSRLHIVVHSRRKLKMALYMIICNALIGHIPIIVCAYGTNSPHPGPFIVPYSVYEKVQVTIFFIQELVLSGMYIAETIKMMRMESGTHLGGKRGNARKLMKHLIVVNIVIVALDITILGLEYAGLFQLQTAYKGLVYSVKLKLEFSILNRLVEMVSGGAVTNSSGRHGGNSMARSRVDKAGIPMDTFSATRSVDAERGRRANDSEYNENIGYNAFVKGGEAGRDPLDTRRGVTRTTEVVVHHSDDIRSDTDSTDGKSGMTDETGLPHKARTRRTRDVSASSSEIQFAKA